MTEFHFFNWDFLVSSSRPHAYQILLRLSKLCVQEGFSGRKSKKQQQRLLRNMGAHAVVLELLQIPYEKVETATPLFRNKCFCAYMWTIIRILTPREKICGCRTS